jgi:ABC-type glutathione transport system ATPase component
VTKEKKKTKLELKLEAARKEKEEAERLAIESGELVKAAPAPLVEAEKDGKKKKDKKQKKVAVDETPPEPEVVATFAPDTASTQPQSHSEQPALGEEEEAMLKSTLFGDEISPEYTTALSNPSDEAGGKLTRKEKRKKQHHEEAMAAIGSYDEAKMKASAEGAQFAVSQSIIDKNDPLWQNSLDINIPSLSISAHNKELFVNTEFVISHGRRYGLVGPNGAGKSTLLKMISAGELKLPPRIDFLYVEQEVLADETPAVDAVLKADR